MRPIRDHYLPPDHHAFVAAEPPTGRVIVIAPTRAACETIELAVGLHIETLLEREHGAQIRELAAQGKGFGIVAGTGTGKTLAIRPISETILGTTDLKRGVVNREREATPETPSWNVVIVTTGIARRWFQDGDILPQDTLVVDEIHQTSAELELCLALGKRVGCRFIWLSATVDPTFYARYLNSAEVLETYAFDPKRAATVRVVAKQPLDFLDEKFLRQVQRERRGVGVFLPTRAAVEEVASVVRRRFPRIEAAFYHGGEPIRIIRPFLEGDVRKPYVLAMTAAGQSALNVHGLDTVIIDDTRFTNLIEHGKNVLTRLHLGANEILQMAGRVHGRVEGGRVFILSDRRIDFAKLEPTEPEFQLAGDSERVALTCADLGVRADELELPVPLDRVAYRQAVALLERRGIIENGRLSRYGKEVEALPVDRPWAELLVHADDELVPFIAVMASIESLHRMTREERNLEGVIVPGSDHLTAYNLYAEAYRQTGYVGEVYGLPRHLFDEGIEAWAIEERGVLVKTIEDAALGMASIYRSLELPLPARMPIADDRIYRAFTDLLARIMPFDLVIDEQTASGDSARVSKTSVCGSWGAIAGELRYFADRFGVPRAAIEGTQIPYDLIQKYATRTAPEVVYDPRRKRSPLVLVRRLEYFGFELGSDIEPLDEFTSELAPAARHALAESLARFEARHPAVKQNRAAIEELRSVYRRSGGRTPKLGLPELTRLYEDRLARVDSLDQFRATNLGIEPDQIVPRAERERYLALPSTTAIRDRDVPIDYDVEDGVGGVAKLRLPEKMARTLVESELPTLDRPLRFVVTRGPRGSVRAATLDELQELLDRPWTPDEVSEAHEHHTRRRDRDGTRRERAAAHARPRGRPGGKRRRRGR
ncbi:MAG TPA: DEAD/DEAH box helicase [Gemmatimonadaceae bacterium]|nr:DEAD/DEAH box helicase [Gemmatimonadaceae bacterium]